MTDSVLRICKACQAFNRVPARHLADAGRCGSCKGPLPPSSEPIEAGAEIFASVISNARVPVLVDFWASWCGPCRAVAPEVKAVAQNLAGQAVVLKVDTEAQGQLAAQYRIQSIPTLMIFLNGKLVLEQAGAVNRDQMTRWLQQAGRTQSASV